MLLLGAAILLTGCGGSAATLARTSPSTGTPSAAVASPGRTSSSSTGGPARTVGVLHPTAGNPAGGGSYGGGQPGPSNPDAGVLGSMSRGFLRPSPYSNVNLEIDVAGAAAPSSAVGSDMVAFLSREARKAVGPARGHAVASPPARGRREHRVCARPP